MNVPGEEIRFHDEGVHAVGGDSKTILLADVDRWGYQNLV
jgi:hypothetical protein